MSRIFPALIIALGLMICPWTVGCGGSSPTVIEQDVSDADAEAAEQLKLEAEQAARTKALAE